MSLLQCLIEQGLSRSAHTAGMHNFFMTLQATDEQHHPRSIGQFLRWRWWSFDWDHATIHRATLGFLLHPSKPRAGFGSSGDMFQCAEGRWVSDSWKDLERTSACTEARERLSQQDFHWIDLREHLQDSPWLLQVFTIKYWGFLQHFPQTNPVILGMKSSFFDLYHCITLGKCKFSLCTSEYFGPT